MTLNADEFSRQGFGSMRLRDDQGDDVDRDAGAVIGAALDAGITMVDTADMYGNEPLVGRAIRGRRDEVVLCSKFGVVWGDDGDWSIRADAAYVHQACEASLRRLGLDVIDLYYLHHRSETTPIEETVSAMAELVEAGQIRALGLSNITEEDVRRAQVVHPIAAVQEQWSLLERGFEEMVPALVELGVTAVAHSPTSHGVLHSPAADASGLTSVLSDIARAHDVVPGQVALAWVHHRSEAWGLRVVPLPGTTSVSHLRANVAAADLILSTDDLAHLDEASSDSRAQVSGDDT